MSRELINRIPPTIVPPTTEWEKGFEYSILNFSQSVADLINRISKVKFKFVSSDISIAEAKDLNALMNMVLVDATSGNVIVTFPPAQLMNPVIITVIKEDSSSNTVTIKAATGEIIKGKESAGSNTVVIVNQGVSNSITSDGQHLHIW